MAEFRVLCGVLLVATLVVAACGSGGRRSPAGAVDGLPLVVLDSPSAPAWVRLLRSAGWSVHAGDLTSILARTAGVVPADAPLAAGDAMRIAAWVERGGHLATADRALLAALGIRREKPLEMRGVAGATWAAPLRLAPLAGDGLEPLAASVPGGKPVVVAARRGSGLVLALAVDPAGGGRAGWELLPHAADLVGARLGAPVGPRSQGAEVFVDPGGLPRSVAGSPARIADLLARAGARVAEVAAWNYDFVDPRNDDDYDSLIRALHARGILAYAWLEPPFVNLRLWQDHPACREKTETGRDALVGWRSLIALEDPRCLRLAEASWRHVLTSHAWDGVNVAELYFEPLAEGAADYTPFSAAALRQFGRDPARDPAGFAAFRTALVTRLNRDVLRFLSTLPGAGRLGLELTVIDDTLDPALGRGVGSDVRALAAVARHAGATLVVEDPSPTWATGPLRYDRLGPHVATLMPPESSFVDVNAVPRDGAHPTAQMTGAELELTIESAAASLGRVGIYSLGTLGARDLAAVAGAAGGQTSTTDLGVYGRWTVRVTAPSPLDRRLAVDGIPWPAAGRTALVPAGNHVLRWSPGSQVGPGLVSFTGQLGTARVSRRRVTFTYDTHPDGLAVVTARPRSLAIDGEATPLRVLADPVGGFVLRVPAGTHTASVGF